MTSSNAAIAEMAAESRWQGHRERDRIVQIDGESKVAIRLVTRVIQDVPKESLDALKTWLTDNHQTITAPLVDGRALAGEWNLGQVYVQSDRMANKQVETWNLYETLWSSGDAAQGYFVSERSCRYLVELSIVYGGSAPPEIPLVSDGAGITYRIVGRNQDDDTGAWEWIIEKRTRQYQENGTTPQDVETSTGRTVTERQQLGVTTQPLEAITKQVGKVKRRRVSINEDCTKDVTTEITESHELGLASIQKRITKAGTFEDASEGTRNKAAGEVAPVPTKIPAAGKTVNFTRRQNEDGTWDVEEREEARPGTVGANKRITPTSGVSDAEVQQGATAEPYTVDPVAGVGEVITVNKSENTDGSWDATKRVDVSPVLANEERIITPKKSVTGTGVKNDRTNPAGPTNSTVGQKVTFRKSQNEDNTWDHMTTVEETTSGLSGSGGANTACGVLGTDTVVQGATAAEMDAAIDAAITALEPGQKLVWSKRENDDGLYDYSYRIEAAPELNSTSITTRIKGGITEDIQRNLATEPDLTTIPEQGVTATKRKDKNADCSWDLSTRIETAPSLTGEQFVYRKDVTVTATRKLNAMEKETASAPGDNTTKQITNDENPDGTWNTSLVESVPSPQISTATYKSRNRAATVYVFRNYTSGAVESLANGLNANNNNSVTGTPNEFGLIDGSASSIAEIESGGGGSGTETPRGYSYSVTLNGVAYNVDVKITSFESTAGTHASGTNISVADLPRGVGEVPGVFYIGRGKFKAVKITTGAPAT